MTNPAAFFHAHFFGIEVLFHEGGCGRFWISAPSLLRLFPRKKIDVFTARDKEETETAMLTNPLHGD